MKIYLGRIADRKHACSATPSAEPLDQLNIHSEKARAMARRDKLTPSPLSRHALSAILARTLLLMFVRYRTNPCTMPSSKLQLGTMRAIMKRREYRLHMETTPPEPIPALVEARWLKLADLALHRGNSKQDGPPPGTRAHQEHQRLEQEIDQALAKHDEPDPANSTKVFDHGQDSSRTHPEPGAKAQPSQYACNGRSRRKATQPARMRAAGR